MFFKKSIQDKAKRSQLICVKLFTLRIIFHLNMLSLHFYKNNRKWLSMIFYGFIKKLKLNTILILFRLTVKYSISYTPQIRKRIAA